MSAVPIWSSRARSDWCSSRTLLGSSRRERGCGETLGAELVVLATGYKGQEHLVRKLFGDDVAARVGPIWGFDEQHELRNMFVRTAQPGLWFIAGSFAQCRIYSKYLALQIKASELGLLPAHSDAAEEAA